MVPSSVEKFISVHDQRTPQRKNADMRLNKKLRQGIPKMGEEARVSIKLVQTRDQSTEHSNLQQDSMQSQEAGRLNVGMMQATLQMRTQHTLHTSISLHNSHGKDMGQMLSTEYSNKQRLNPKEEYSAS